METLTRLATADCQPGWANSSSPWKLDNPWGTRAFVFEAAAGTVLEAAIDGPGDGLFTVSGPFGVLLEVNDYESGIESGAVELPVDGAHFLQVGLAPGPSSQFDLGSTVRLKPLHRPG